MRRGWGPGSFVLPLLLAHLTVPGTGNEGSSTGNCHCDVRFSKSPPTVQLVEFLRKQVKTYESCAAFVRFHLPRRTVCGGSTDQWVTELMSCIDRRECGHAYSGRVVHPEHLPSPSTQVPESTERARAVMSTPAQTPLPPTSQSTQQPTLAAGALLLDQRLTHTSETTTSSVSHSLESEENQKQMKENVGPTAGTHVMVPVLSLLAIVFILTGVLLYVLCKRRSKQSLKYSLGKVDL